MIKLIPKSELSKRVRGRGSADQTVGRFERYQRVAVNDGWQGDVDDTTVRTQVRIEKPRKIITKNKSPDLNFDQSVNPYRGCEHGCIYCFARPSHAFLNMSPGLDFETQLLARPSAADLLAKEISNPQYKVQPIAFGTNTDPYQPIENTYKVMRRCLEVLQEFKHPVIITTKGALIERDLDILSDLAGQGLVRVGITVTTLDKDISRRLEPRVPAPKRLLKTIKELSGAGVPTRVLMSPIIPGLTDHEIENVLTAAKKAGAYNATFALLRLPLEVSQLFQTWLRQHYPDKFSKVMARIRETHGGRDYDPEWGKRLRGEGAHAELIAQRFELACDMLGLTQELPALRTDLFHVPPRPGDQLSLF